MGQTVSISCNPVAVSSDGTHVWLTSNNCAGGIGQPSAGLYELNDSDGSFVGNGNPVFSALGVLSAVSSDSTHVWVAGIGLNGNGTVDEVDASTGSVVQTVGVGTNPEGISSDGTHVWVTNFVDSTVSELNASTGSVVQTIGVGRNPSGISSDGTHVWLANHYGNTVTELDASTGSVVRTVGVGSEPMGVSSDGTHVWVANLNDNTVSKLNASTGALVQTISVGSSPEGVSSDGTHVWVTNSADNTVTELNASDGSVVDTFGVGSEPMGVSSDGTHVWVANYNDGTMSEIAVPPSTFVILPSNRAVVSGSTILDASASNATNVKFLLFGGIYGFAAPVICTATPTFYGWLCVWDTTTVPNGSYALVAEASNAAGSGYGKVSITVKN